MPTGALQIATIGSLIVQVITGYIGAYGLTLPVQSKDKILKQVLGLEMLVQGIEFIFYLSFLAVPNIISLTQRRYHDWFLSTPVMLFTTALYFYYVNNIEDSMSIEPEKSDLTTFIVEHWRPIAIFVLLNFAMLLFGYLGEFGMIDKWLAFWLGSAALVGSFATIYRSFAEQSEKTKRIFWLMFGLWAMYGFVFLAGPIPKNIGYTVLDLFAKNFFGVFLAYSLASKSTLIVKL
jgi:hypothetical protein